MKMSFRVHNNTYNSEGGVLVLTMCHKSSKNIYRLDHCFNISDNSVVIFPDAYI